jgi:tetratricopeptide (TPR) repeat protein
MAPFWGPPVIKQWERAVELDPEFAEGWADLAGAHAELGIHTWGAQARAELLAAQVAARRALELDDHLVGPHVVLAAIQLYYEWDFEGAGRTFEEALHLSPSEPGALDGYAWYLLATGRAAEALEVSERLLRVAPLDFFYRVERMRYFFSAGQYERGLEEVERIRELDSNFHDFEIATAYMMLGRLEEAHQAFVESERRCGTPCDLTREARERGWAEGGWVGSMRSSLEVAAATEWVAPNILAVGYTAIGETDEALRWLERAYEERMPVIATLKHYPIWDPLRSEPRFQDLLRRIGFPED